MSSRPLIGITLDHDREQTRYQLHYDYVRAILAAGGMPLLLPFDASVDPGEQLRLVDGLLLTGGNDLDPSAWGEARHPEAVAIDPEREAHERALLAEAARRDLPVLAICCGMQVLNAQRGGSLHQHLPDLPGTSEHRRGDEGWARRHPVTVAAGSVLARVCGEGEVEVNTSHHQAVARLGQGLIISAEAPDGTVEAIEDPARAFCIGVQWHPERLAATDERHAALFEALVRAAAESKAEPAPAAGLRSVG